MGTHLDCLISSRGAGSMRHLGHQGQNINMRSANSKSVSAKDYGSDRRYDARRRRPGAENLRRALRPGAYSKQRQASGLAYSFESIMSSAWGDRVAGRDVQIESIRGGRPKPGLAAQHVASLKLVADVTGAALTGAVKGSSTASLEFAAKPHATSFLADAGTAGSTVLMLQSVRRTETKWDRRRSYPS